MSPYREPAAPPYKRETLGARLARRIRYAICVAKGHWWGKQIVGVDCVCVRCGNSCEVCGGPRDWNRAKKHLTPPPRVP